MAWYNSGDWSAVRVDRRGVILQQMLYAINERQTAVGRTLSTWDSSIGANPASWKLDGWRVDRAGALLQQIRDAIPSLYDTAQTERFVQSDGSNWTAAALFTEAGYGASWLVIDGEITNDVRPFLQTRAVIEELIYYLDGTTAMLTVTRPVKKGQQKTLQATAQAAYDYCVANITDIVTDPIYLQLNYVLASNTWSFFLRNEVKWLIKFPLGVTPIGFTLPFYETLSLDTGASAPDQFDILINGVAYTMTRSTTGTDNFDVVIGTDVPLGYIYQSGGYWYSEVIGEIDLPANQPFYDGSFTANAFQSITIAFVTTNPVAVTERKTLTPTYG